MKLIPVIADNWRIDGGVAYGVVPRLLWSRWHDADENNMIAITNRCLLVADGDRNILIDTGLGDKRPEKYYSLRYREQGVNLIKSLEEAGVAPAEITDIIFTHLHDDHVGGATRNVDGRAEPVFPNAQYWVSEVQWHWAMNPNKRETAAYFADNLLPLQQSERLHLLKPEEQPFYNISLRMYNGHTRGQIIPFIKTENGTVVYLGDFIPTPGNIPLPYIASVDIEPLVTLDEKEAFLQEAFENLYILFFEHDAQHECCRLVKNEKGLTAGPSFRLNEPEKITV